MLLGFKRRFAPLVFDGSKTHSIRAMRKDGKVPAVGETLHCYVDPRQKTMQLLGRWECVRVETIEIYTRGDGTFEVLIERVELSLGEKNLLAHRDGFRSDDPFLEMMRFWAETHHTGKVIGIRVKRGGHQEPRCVFGTRKSLDFVGHIIHWRFSESTRAPEEKDIMTDEKEKSL